ncbi:MAG TPA: ATP-dependent DNA helicase RecG [Syntrophales bacterium]|nr:ATP-dependent DNA helicase RecG [Syntrophales bacterium]HPI55917.1 ATP-dependent DNA helicase RecG [Syntrophales bacterium]HPN23592.1 ATP-dependent DNA helicase RecG [Syntrophales bacterium]HQM27883.1 ATP-dependent DNA helicase RecG [Syntrophales bacterium]
MAGNGTYRIGGEGRSSQSSFEKLTLPVRYVKGVGPRLSALLERKGLITVEDMIYFLPRKYEDRRVVKSISATQPGVKETIVGEVHSAQIRPYRRRKVFEVRVADETGTLTAKWFHGNYPFLKKIFERGRRVIFTGEIKGFLFEKELIHPDFEVLEEDDDQLLHFKRIVPIYSETEGLGQKNLRRIMKHVVDDFAGCVLSPLPKDILERQGLQDISQAIRTVHFPEADSDIEGLNSMKSEAHRRVIFDEFFFFELGMALRKKGTLLQEGVPLASTGEGLKTFFHRLPYVLTAAQHRVIAEITGDMEKAVPMHRLLQGDVGCGKTVVSMAAMIVACENGCQAAMMAPTEILAEQHHRNIANWADAQGLKTAILTGSMKTSERKKAYSAIERGEVDIVVGTHALIQEGVKFRKLGLAIVDEQHRFGVVQRALLREKGPHPHVLVMTATPIPRTLAMTVYGDLDVSVIDEMPPGKKPVKTKIFYEKERRRVYDIIRKEILKGNQVFIVYPLVEESENLDLRDATRMAEHLQQDVYPEFEVGLMHGRMKSREKEGIMDRFLAKDIHLLVSTTVIEVGIDIPQASLMVIEHAERFGLAQLHQLRGRVGRGDIPSYCILMSGHPASDVSAMRLRVMEQTTDGFRIAEEDLAIRGPGEFLGTRQSGLPDFRVANILRDGRILNEARQEAFRLIDRDAFLEQPEHRLLKDVLLRRWEGRLDLARTG